MGRAHRPLGAALTRISILRPEVTAITGLEINVESRIAIMANRTGLSICHHIHGDFSRTGLHFEQGRVTGIAAVARSMDPMRKSRSRQGFRAHAAFFAWNDNVTGRRDDRG